MSNKESWEGHAMSFTKDTKVSLMDSRELSFEELIKEFSGRKRFWVYGCDNKGNIVPALAHSPRKTRENAKILKITFDNGEVVKCTEDHLFLMRDGTYKEACKLEKGDSLMPLYRRLDERGYEQFFNPATQKWYYTHRSAVLQTRGPYEGVVHHKDFNKRNNSPDNLEVMTWEEHTKLHSEYTILLNRYAKSEEGRQKSRELMTNNWSDPQFIEKMKKINAENGKKVSAKLKKEGRLGFQSIPKEVMKIIGKKYGSKNITHLLSEESKRKSAETRKIKWEKDEDYANKMIEIARKNISEYNKKLSAGEVKLTEKQIKSRKENMKKLNQTLNQDKEKMRLRQLKTTYTRFYKDKYPTFEEYLKSEDCKYYNHQVVRVEEYGFEDVYDLTVGKYHSFALSAGVFSYE